MFATRRICSIHRQRVGVGSIAGSDVSCWCARGGGVESVLMMLFGLAGRAYLRSETTGASQAAWRTDFCRSVGRVEVGDPV